MKVKVVFMATKVGILFFKKQEEALSTDPSFMKDLSKSISVGTRKMVNYAWSG